MFINRRQMDIYKSNATALLLRLKMSVAMEEMKNRPPIQNTSMIQNMMQSPISLQDSTTPGVNNGKLYG